MSRLSWLLASVAGRPEPLNREAYEEIAREHLHEVVQTAAAHEEAVEELNEEIADLKRELAEAEGALEDANDKLTAIEKALHP